MESRRENRNSNWRRKFREDGTTHSHPSTASSVATFIPEKRQKTYKKLIKNMFAQELLLQNTTTFVLVNYFNILYVTDFKTQKLCFYQFYVVVTIQPLSLFCYHANGIHVKWNLYEVLILSIDDLVSFLPDGHCLSLFLLIFIMGRYLYYIICI